MMHIQAHCIEGAAHIEPVGWSDHPFIAERKNLAAGNDVDPAFGRTAGLNIGLADIPDILIRKRIGNVLIEKDARVLRLPEKSEPFHRLKLNVKPQAAEEIGIVRGRIPDAIFTLEAKAVFAAETKP